MALTRTQRDFNSTPAQAAFDSQLRRIFRKKWFNKDAEIGYLGWCDGWATRRRQDDCENSIEAVRKTGLRRRLPVLDEIEKAKDGTKKALKEVVAEVSEEVEGKQDASKQAVEEDAAEVPKEQVQQVGL